ncbi:MAG: rRNA pseudouridine synthase [Patescibacteria group bacterium]|nr:rRNA pseudouridine synthase [Patescibacteria group bacterium]MCL5257777.1 rRNA pseudouridine synthase [Patescibacteria group bacterium]
MTKPKIKINERVGLIRLNKFLSQAGISSRRQADILISQGAIKVNGKIVKKLGFQIDQENDRVEIINKLVEVQSQKIVYLVNKPIGVVSTAKDEQGRKTVLDLVPSSPRVFPCGRLDFDTTGLMILTNDGELCYNLTHPKFEQKKEYLVEAESKGQFEKILDKIKAGVLIERKKVKVENLKIIWIRGKKIKFSLVIHEGRNRIVRKLSQVVGLKILRLTRVRFGPYRLDQLKPGQFRLIKLK